MQTVKTKVRSAPHYSIASNKAEFSHHAWTKNWQSALEPFIQYCLSANVSVTNTLGQSPRLVFVSRIRTTSPMRRFLEGFNHFWRCWSRGKYSLTHLFQKQSASNCTDRHERRKPSASIKTSAGRQESSVPVRSDAGVNTDKSSAWSLTGVGGRLFRIFSTSTNNEWIASSSRARSPARECKIVLTDLTRISHAPPLDGERGCWSATPRLSDIATRESGIDSNGELLHEVLFRRVGSWYLCRCTSLRQGLFDERI